MLLRCDTDDSTAAVRRQMNVRTMLLQPITIISTVQEHLSQKPIVTSIADGKHGR